MDRLLFIFSDDFISGLIATGAISLFVFVVSTIWRFIKGAANKIDAKDETHEEDNDISDVEKGLFYIKEKNEKIVSYSATITQLGEGEAFYCVPDLRITSRENIVNQEKLKAEYAIQISFFDG